MAKVQRSISFDLMVLAEFDKRAIDLNDLINQLLAEHLAFIQIKEETAEKRKEEARKELEKSSYNNPV